MNLIGEKIKVLRKCKGITQNELGAGLSVSSQSVSKWERGVSVPDISLLPLIARYFGITMDELFGYRLDALNYKERFIRFMIDNGMLRFGEFKLQSGRYSPYLIHSGFYKNGQQISKLGEFFAKAIRDNSVERSILVGNSQRETPLVIATSMTLYNKYGMETDYCVDLTLENSYDRSQEMTLITDTFTSGNTLKRALNEIKKYSGKYPSNVIVSVDRMERGYTSSISARREIEICYGVKIHSIVTFDDIIKAMENGVILREEYLEKMNQYRRNYVEAQDEHY